MAPRWGGITLAVVIGIGTLAPSAQAGGWFTFIGTEDSFVIAGARAEIRERAYIPGAEPGKGEPRFYAYLLLDYDRDAVDRAMSRPYRAGWWQTPRRALRLGRLHLSGWRGSFATVTARFVVPDLEPGRYELMACDLGCEHAFPFAVPTTITIVESSLSGRLLRRVNRLHVRVFALHRRIRAVKDGVVRTQMGFATDSELVRVHQRADRLERQVDALAARSARSPVRPWAVAAVAILMAVVGGLVHKWRRRRQRSNELPPIEVPAEPVEDGGADRRLTGSVSAHNNARAHLNTVTIPTTTNTSPNRTTGPTHQSS